MKQGRWHPLVLTSIYLLPVIAGLAHLALAGLAPSKLALQSAAGIVGGGLMLAMRLARPAVWAIIMSVGAVLMFVPLFMPHGLDGIARWIVVGGIRLHIGFLLVPALVTWSATQAPSRTAMLAAPLCALALALQPDRGMAIAFALPLALLALVDRTWQRLGMALAGVGALVATVVRPDPLGPVRYVEYVLVDPASPPLALALAWACALALPIPGLLAVRHGQQMAGLAFAGVWAGAVIASLIGPYPTPVAGYGASAIIGFGLSLAALHRRAI